VISDIPRLGAPPDWLFVTMQRRKQARVWTALQAFLISQPQSRKAGGTGPPANHQEVRMPQAPLFLSLIVVTLEVKVNVRIIIRKR
jgi:hypothetical protein